MVLIRRINLESWHIYFIRGTTIWQESKKEINYHIIIVLRHPSNDTFVANKKY